MWQKLASCKPSALAGLVFVVLLEEGVAEGDVARDSSAVLAERVELLFSFLFGCVINHLCSELCWCDSLLRARAVCRAQYIHGAFILLPKVCKVL